MCKKKIQQDFIVRMKQEENKVVTKKIFKISVKYIKGNREFYLSQP